jgi:cytochrome c
MSDTTKPASAISPFWDVTISAFWVAFLAVLGVNIVTDRVFFPTASHEAEGEEQVWGYAVEVPEVEVAAGPAGPAARPDIKPMLATATVEAGAAAFRKCQTCHSIEPGGKNGTGPNLHNIVGDAVADRNGFKISDSLRAVGGNWDYDKLDDYIENPKRLAPRGTMSFAGIKKPDERAAVIKFLMANTENPPPVPASAPPAAEAAPAEAAPAAETPAPAAPN